MGEGSACLAGSNRRIALSLGLFVFVAVLAAGPVSAAHAQSEPSAVEERLRRLEAANAAIIQQNQELAARNDELTQRVENLTRRIEDQSAQTASTPIPAEFSSFSAAPAGTSLPSLPAASLPELADPSSVQNPGSFAPAPATFAAPAFSPPTTANCPQDQPRFGVGYDNGFILFRDETGRVPFELKMNFWNQFRYFGFARLVDEWTDSAGITRPIVNRSAFEIVRGRLIFTGFAYDPRLEYYVNLDYNTLLDDRVSVLGAWVDYRFSERLAIYAGKWKVASAREWQRQLIETLGPDASMATTFFRPSFTTGIWAAGKPNERLYYRLMLGDGFNTGSAAIPALDDNFSYSGDLVWEPLEPFGITFSDLQWHEKLAVRLGTSGVYSRQEGPQEDAGPEEAFIRLSDGTLLTETGALAPGVTLDEYEITLCAVDAGLKYRGLSLTGEYFFRWLSHLQGDGPIPIAQIFDSGAYAQMGYFLIPQRFEVYGRTSQISGPYGSGGEYAGGFNWFIRGRNGTRVTFDAARLYHSPADQIRTNYEAGASGWLFRMQLQTAF